MNIIVIKSTDFSVKGRLKQPVIFDGRNLLEPAEIKAFGIESHWIEGESAC